MTITPYPLLGGWVCGHPLPDAVVLQDVADISSSFFCVFYFKEIFKIIKKIIAIRFYIITFFFKSIISDW